MVESVDTRDLKSLGHCGRVGSSPTSGTNNRADNHLIINPVARLIYFHPLIPSLGLDYALFHDFHNGFAQVLNDVTSHHAIGAMLLSCQVAGQSMEIHT